jgi:hypothetical protein
MPIQVDGIQLRAMSGTELSRDPITFFSLAHSAANHGSGSVSDNPTNEELAPWNFPEADFPLLVRGSRFDYFRVPTNPALNGRSGRG